MEVDKLAVARMIAKELIKHRDTVNGMLLLSGREVMSDRELIGAARCALQLVESGAVK